MATGKINSIIKAVPEIKMSFLGIPFISNKMEDSVKILAFLNFTDLWKSLVLSVKTSLYLYCKYSKTFQMFRAHSSYEFYITCFFVEKTPSEISFVYFSLIDKWAYLFANDTKHSNILIQHGILEDIPYVRMNAPHKVYYVNKKQKEILEKRLFSIKPVISQFRPLLQFSGEQKLLKNGKMDVLVVCCPKFIEQERRIIGAIATVNKYNLYVKTHPGFSNNEMYDELQSKFKFVLLEKYDYPKVNYVVSYNSTLAIEYMDVGVTVYKYDDSDFENNFKKLLEI